jgi:hypothetical protein
MRERPRRFVGASIFVAPVDGKLLVLNGVGLLVFLPGPISRFIEVVALW